MKIFSCCTELHGTAWKFFHAAWNCMKQHGIAWKKLHGDNDDDYGRRRLYDDNEKASTVLTTTTKDSCLDYSSQSPS
jgi:hypothetical protein